MFFHCCLLETIFVEDTGPVYKFFFAVKSGSISTYFFSFFYFLFFVIFIKREIKMSQVQNIAIVVYQFL